MVGECEVWMRLASAPCGISLAMEGSGDEGAIYHGGREGGVGMAKWGDCWCDHLTRVGSARWGLPQDWPKLAKVIQWWRVAWPCAWG